MKHFPLEVTKYILSLCDDRDINAFGCTNKYFNYICNEIFFNRKQDEGKSGLNYYSHNSRMYHLTEMAHRYQKLDWIDPRLIVYVSNKWYLTAIGIFRNYFDFCLKLGWKELMVLIIQNVSIKMGIIDNILPLYFPTVNKDVIEAILPLIPKKK